MIEAGTLGLPDLSWCLARLSSGIMHCQGLTIHIADHAVITRLHIPGCLQPCRYLGLATTASSFGPFLRCAHRKDHQSVVIEKKTEFLVPFCRRLRNI